MGRQLTGQGLGVVPCLSFPITLQVRLAGTQPSSPLATSRLPRVRCGPIGAEQGQGKEQLSGQKVSPDLWVAYGNGSYSKLWLDQPKGCRSFAVEDSSDC